MWDASSRGCDLPPHYSCIWHCSELPVAGSLCLVLAWEHNRHRLLVATVQRPTGFLHCRLEPSGKSHVFALHGQECRKSNAHPKCTMERNTPGWPKGMLYMLDIIDILRQGGQEWPVRLQAFRHTCSCCSRWQEQGARPLAADCQTAGCI